VPTPFSVVSGGTYSLGAGASQVVTVRYSPTVVATNNQTVTFTGGAGATRPVTASRLSRAGDCGDAGEPGFWGDPSEHDGRPDVHGAEHRWRHLVGDGFSADAIQCCVRGHLQSGGGSQPGGDGTIQSDGGGDQQSNRDVHRWRGGDAAGDGQRLSGTGDCGDARQPGFRGDSSEHDGRPDVHGAEHRWRHLVGDGFGADAIQCCVRRAPTVWGQEASQVVTVRYSPTVVGTNNQTVTFTGGAGATRPVTAAPIRHRRLR